MAQQSRPLMMAWRVHEYGSPDVMRFDSIPTQDRANGADSRSGRKRWSLCGSARPWGRPADHCDRGEG